MVSFQTKIPFRHRYAVPAGDVTNGDRLNFAKSAVRLLFRQRDDIDRLADMSEDLFGNAAEEGVAECSFPMRPHDDRVALDLISFVQDFRRGIAFDEVNSDNPLQGVRIVFELSFGKLFQAILDRLVELFFRTVSMFGL